MVPYNMNANTGDAGSGVTVIEPSSQKRHFQTICKKLNEPQRPPPVGVFQHAPVTSIMGMLEFNLDNDIGPIIRLLS